MAFPSDKSGRTEVTTARVFLQTLSQASRIYEMATGVQAKYATNNMSLNVAIAVIDQMKDSLTLFAQARATPGIAQFARDFYNDQTLDVVAGFNAMEAECVLTRDWIVARVPLSTDGYLKEQQFDVSGDGSRNTRIFTPAQLSGLFTQLAALAATIEYV